MKPLIFEFLEEPTTQVIENPFEYSAAQNLSVDKKTKQAAIEYASLDTNTFTKAGDEPSDSDYNLTRAYMDTLTGTLNYDETSDNDNDIRSLKAILDTQTLTESKESTDSDN